MVLLGGKHRAAKIEVHDIAFAVADSLDDARPQLLAQWFGERKGVHVDAWMQIEGADGYQVTIRKRPPLAKAPRLYFLHLGGYDNSRFGEDHSYELIVATSLADAKAKSKVRRLASWSKPHTDAVRDVDACFAIERVGEHFVHLRAGSHGPHVFENTYLVLN